MGQTLCLSCFHYGRADQGLIIIGKFYNYTIDEYATMA